MDSEKEVSVIIAAAGQGTRIGGPVPKQFMMIGGEPILIKTLKVFSSMPEVDHIFIVTNEEYTEHCADLVREYGIGKVERIVRGGSERQDSVFNALGAVEETCPQTGYVLIHDGARPFVTHRTVIGVIEKTVQSGAAVACVPMKDSLRQVGSCGLYAKKNTDASGMSRSVDRSEYFAVQTPQGFRFEYIKEAYEKAFSEGFYGTDDAVLAERAGYPVSIAEGDYGNIKITTREDLPMEYRTGTGFDVHAFAEGRDLVLGGVKIPYEKGLAGHSDADVLTHALMDALLGAAALGDIGKHFPDTDEQYRGISSMVLLQKVGELLEKNSYSVVNADVTVMAQAPRISTYTEAMRENIAAVLKLDKSRINIKGTTTERLGFVGRKEGIAAEAVCSICR